LLNFADFYVDTTTDSEVGKRVNELAQTEEYQEVAMLFKSWLEKGLVKGRQEGAEITRVTTARNFLRLGAKPEMVSKATGLSMARVRALARRQPAARNQAIPTARRTTARRKTVRKVD
jgi:hypothetical protein